MNSPSHYIWCPLKTFGTIDPETGKFQQDSVGPNQHINLCLWAGCGCSDLEDRIEELERYRHGDSN